MRYLNYFYFMLSSGCFCTVTKIKVILSAAKMLQFGHSFKQSNMKVLAQFLNGALFECNIWHFQYKSQLENAKQTKIRN